MAVDAETCRWQIEQSSGVKTVHPVWVLHAAYGLSRLAGVEPSPIAEFG